MKYKLPRATQKNNRMPKAKSLDTLLEEYMSKLEQKVVSQTHQLKTITDNAASCLSMIDTQGKATFMNPAAGIVTGYALDEIKDLPLYKIIEHAHAQANSTTDPCPIIVSLRDKTQVKDQEDIFIRKDGSQFPISFSIAPLYQDGRSQGAVLEFQDITKRKELERQKDDFIAVASHELKTPVTSMKTYTQVLKRKFERQGDNAAAESLGKIDTQINKLSSLIVDLLDATRTETGNLHLRQETFDLDTLVCEVVETTQLTTQKHKISIKGNTNALISADRDRTSQVLVNFLSNAIKYSPRSSTIIVHLKATKKEVRVGVQDFGIGIPSDKIDYIFERFMRVSGPQMETFSGLGLGLYISSEFIKRHKGTIGVESEIGDGSTFYFTIPIAN